MPISSGRAFTEANNCCLYLPAELSQRQIIITRFQQEFHAGKNKEGEGLSPFYFKSKLTGSQSGKYDGNAAYFMKKHRQNLMVTQ